MVGRIQKHKIKGFRLRSGSCPQLRRVAAMDAGVSEQPERFDIVADGAPRRLVRLNKEAEGGAA